MSDFNLKFDNITLSRGATPIVDGLTLHIQSADLIWVRGANGIGKSSILRLAAGLLRPDHGAVIWEDKKQAVSASQIVSYQAHKDPLKPNLSLFQNLAFWARQIGRIGHITPALNKVGLTGFETRRAGTLSAGQSRRAALAKLLIDNKPIWIMDEPAASIDIAGIDIIDSLISQHINSGGAVMIASHAAPKALSERARLLTLHTPSQNEDELHVESAS